MINGLPKINTKSLKIYSKDDFPKYLPNLNKLYDDLFANGKHFRARFVTAISKTLFLKNSQIHLLSQSIEFIHNASLLHDDLIDKTILRRGRTAAWKKYGAKPSILAGDYLLARVMINLSSNSSLALVHYTAKTAANLTKGEWLQDAMEKKQKKNKYLKAKLALQERDKIAQLKTGVLFSWCLVAPFLLLKDNLDTAFIKSLEAVGNDLGILFQRGDDLLDFNIRNKEKKSFLNDLKAGVLNSFAIFLIKDNLKLKTALLKCQTITEVKNLISTKVFNQSLKAFDKINQKIIDKYYKKVDLCLDKAKTASKCKKKELKSILLAIPDIFYWRAV